MSKRGGRAAAAAAGTTAAAAAEEEVEVEEFDSENPFGKPSRKKGKRAEAGEDDVEEIPIDEYGAKDLRGILSLKKDHSARPLLVTPDCEIFLETFSPLYKQAYDFVIAIAEPVTRPELIHMYRLTPYSLYAAAAIGLKTESIIKHLGQFSKTNVPERVVETIRTYTQRMGKVRLVLKGGKYFLETRDPTAFKVLLTDEVIRDAKLEDGVEFHTGKASRASDIEIAGMAATAAARRKNANGPATDEELLQAAENTEREMLIPDDMRTMEAFEQEEEEEDSENLYFQLREPRVLYRHLGPGGVGCKCGDNPCKKQKDSPVLDNPVEAVQKRCSPEGLDFPLMAEYDFKADKSLPDLKIDLKPTCLLRPYQEKSLRKMFGSGRALSGIIVLPCGAGKTLTGVAAASTVRKSVIVLCTSGVAVEQWCSEFRRWSTVDHRLVCKFTAEDREVPPDNCVLVCTYSILAQKTSRAAEAQRVMDALLKREWGMMILDEVQTAPAKEFRTLLTRFPAHCKLGLTATLVREDDKITDLRFLIGPKLYEANWIDLQESGHIARVKVAEVWCPMAPAFYSEYLATSYNNLRLQLLVCNPVKLNICEYLIRHHEKVGDKIIVMSDDIFALRTLGTKLGKAYIDGGTPPRERLEVLYKFKNARDMNSRTIFISKIGDVAIDLPDANVLIQISSHGGSRRQEAQRLGRILRAKKGGKTKPGEYNAFFYTLISTDTREMAYATARQRFLVDQGYSYKVIKASALEGPMEIERAQRPMAYDSEMEQSNLLRTILTNKSNDSDADGSLSALLGGTASGGAASAMRRERAMGSMSGADGSLYQEVRNAPARNVRHALFKRRNKVMQALTSSK